MIKSIDWLKFCVSLGVIALISLAIFLWAMNPDLFLYFNQAFCAH